MPTVRFLWEGSEGCGEGFPYLGIVGEGDFRATLAKYREEQGSRAGEFGGLRFDPSDEEVRGFLGILMGPFGIVLMLWGCSEGEAGRVDKERGLLPVSALSQCEECEGGLLEQLEEEMKRWGWSRMWWGWRRCGWMPRASRGCSWKASELCMLEGRKKGSALFIREGLMYRE